MSPWQTSAFPLGAALKQQLALATIFAGPWQSYARVIANERFRREENAMRRLLMLGLPAGTDDETLAKRMGHHEMWPEELCIFFPAIRELEDERMGSVRDAMERLASG